LEDLLLKENAEYKHYQLRVVGHSLGAGAGSLVALFLQSKCPNVRAVVYEPPGCTMSLNLAEESNEWCISFVTGNDAVPRITATALITFRNEVLVNLARIKVPKHVIMAHRNVDQNGIDAVKEFLQESLYPHHEIPDNPFVDSVHEFFKFVHAAVQKKGTDDMLHLPGKIIHLASESYALQSSGEGSGGKKSKKAEEKPKHVAGDNTALEESRKYQTCWAKRKDFQRIILSSHLMSDHFTDTINAAFEGRMKSTGMDQPYSEAILHILPCMSGSSLKFE
jgi:sn1-specific diacylglycerol lipase